VSHTNSVTHKQWHTQTVAHTNSVTYKQCHTQTVSHINSVTHKQCHTQTVSHTNSGTHKQWHTQTVSHTNSVTQKHGCSNAYQLFVLLVLLQMCLLLLLHQHTESFHLCLKHLLLRSSIVVVLRTHPCTHTRARAARAVDCQSRT